MTLDIDIVAYLPIFPFSFQNRKISIGLCPSICFNYIIEMAGAVAKVPTLINTAIASARPKFNIFMKYARVEMAPPKISELPQIRAGIGKLLTSAKTGAWKDQTLKQATLNVLVGAEVLFWFYIGECIGKRHIVGYNV